MYFADTISRENFAKKMRSWNQALKAVFHFKRIVAFSFVSIPLVRFYPSAHGTKKYATFQCDTGEAVENRLKDLWIRLCYEGHSAQRHRVEGFLRAHLVATFSPVSSARVS